MTPAEIENLIRLLNQRYQDLGDTLARKAADALAEQRAGKDKEEIENLREELEECRRLR